MLIIIPEINLKDEKVKLIKHALINLMCRTRVERVIKE